MIIISVNQHLLAIKQHIITYITYIVISARHLCGHFLGGEFCTKLPLGLPRLGPENSCWDREVCRFGVCFSGMPPGYVSRLSPQEEMKGTVSTVCFGCVFWGMFRGRVARVKPNFPALLKVERVKNCKLMFLYIYIV